MSDQLMEPQETDNIECNLQQTGMGSLICRAARQTGENTTNEVNPTICFHCEAGKIFRDIGCDAVTPKIRIFKRMGGESYEIQSLLCKIRRRATDFEFCKNCNLVNAETTRQIISTARALFQAGRFYSAYTDLEKARESIRDGNFENSITRSISCLESTMRICHERLGQSLPEKKQLSDLWKSTRALLHFDEIDPFKTTLALMNGLTGVVMQLGGLRNALGDAHGKGVSPPAVSESIAEFVMNSASTLSTMIIRRFDQLEDKKNG